MAGESEWKAKVLEKDQHFISSYQEMILNHRGKSVFFNGKFVFEPNGKIIKIKEMEVFVDHFQT